MGVLPAPRPFVVDVELPPHPGLVVTAFAPAVVEGEHLKALLPEAGAIRLLAKLTDANGQDGVVSVPVYVAPPAPAVTNEFALVPDDQRGTCPAPDPSRYVLSQCCLRSG